MINKVLFFLILLFTQSVSYSQLMDSIDIRLIKGIWIEKNFLKSFSRTLNINDSKSSFAYELPVAIRINPAELINDTLNIGYEVLHNHIFSPEISGRKTINSNVVEEAGYMSVFSDSILRFPISVGEINYFNEKNYPSYLSLKRKDNTLSLLISRQQSANLPVDTIEYVRFEDSFSGSTEHPNPLRFYTTSILLKGEYILQDSSGTILTDNLRITQDGEFIGYFDKTRIVYDTDIFCEPPMTNHLVKTYPYPVENYLNPHFTYYAIEKSSSSIILFEFSWKTGKRGKKRYTLIKKA